MYACRGFACRFFKERLQNLNIPALVLYMSASLNAGNVAQYVHKNMGRVRHLSVFYTECFPYRVFRLQLHSGSVVVQGMFEVKFHYAVGFHLLVSREKNC